MLNIIAQVVWFWCQEHNPYLFGLVWSIPYLLGYRSAWINFLLCSPKSLFDEKQVNRLRFEIFRMGLIVAGFLSDGIYQLECDLLWWETFTILIEACLEYNMVDDQNYILNLRLILYLVSTFTSIIQHFWMTPITILYLVFNLAINYPV